MGCDLCGFNGDAPGDLCTRWHQVGTLFPFARNHNQNATTSQEPFVFNFTLPKNVSDNQNITYTDVMRTAIRNRYTLIRYYYSQFWQINEEGGSFFKPLFFDFGDDPNAYKVIEKNMLLGDHLKASVETTNLTKQDKVDFYFPTGTWCQIIPYRVSDFS
jgi:alpha-glucosidase